MPDWTWDRVIDLTARLGAIVDGLDDRLEDVTQGRVSPAPDDLTIGSARHVRAATLFFDIRGFSALSGSPERADLKRTLFILDCVIPMMMHVLFDYEAYVEKNTGDGLMAILGAEMTDQEAARKSLLAAVEMFYVLQFIVNPVLEEYGIADIDARIGIDLGDLLIARLGVHSGTAKHGRSMLTAVGPSANLACRLQQLGGTNEIWCGDLVKRTAPTAWSSFFREVTPQDWTWSYTGYPTIPYPVWHFAAARKPPD